MISQNEMTLNPRKRPKSPPMDDTKVTGPIEMLRSISAHGDYHLFYWRDFYLRQWLCTRLYFSGEPYQAQILVQKRCSAQQCPPPKRRKLWTRSSVVDSGGWLVLCDHLLRLLQQGVKVSTSPRAVDVLDVIGNISRIHPFHLMEECLVYLFLGNTKT